MKENKIIEQRMEDIKSQSIVYIYESIFKDYIYKGRDMLKFYEQVKEMIPSSAEFFVEWFKGFVSVAAFDIESAKIHYLEALKTAASADEYLTHFLQQGFALFMYVEDKENAVKFWNFGAEKSIFAPADERLFESFISKEQFWVQFSPAMFNDRSCAEEKIIADYRKESADKLQRAIDTFDYKLFQEASEGVDFDSYLIENVSVLYYAIQRNGALCGGSQKFTDDLIAIRTNQMLSTLDLSSLSDSARQQQYLTILHQLRVTYEKSGLANLMYIASNCRPEEAAVKKAEMDKIISAVIQLTSDVNSFEKRIEGKMAANALYLAAELDDEKTVKLLLEKGADHEKILGSAEFGMRYSDGRKVSTSVPNSFIYRLISFRAWKCLKYYLSRKDTQIQKVMTEKTEKCNITPLVFFLLNTIYTAASEAEFNSNKALADEFIPLFQNAGAVLEENTAFGSAKNLLGMK